MTKADWESVLYRHLLPMHAGTAPGAWLAALSSRAFALLRTLETASPTETLCGKICWSQFHHRVLGGAAFRLVESELKAGDLPAPSHHEEAVGAHPVVDLAIRRHQELLRLVRLQMREAFGTSEHSHPACLTHRTVAELEPVMGCPFGEDLLGGSIHRELRRRLTRHPGILPAARVLLETFTTSVVDYWNTRPANEDAPARFLPLTGPDLSSEFPDAYC